MYSVHFTSVEKGLKVESARSQEKLDYSASTWKKLCENNVHQYPASSFDASSSKSASTRLSVDRPRLHREALAEALCVRPVAASIMMCRALHRYVAQQHSRLHTRARL